MLASESGYENALWLLYSVLDPILHEGLEVGDIDKNMIEKGEQLPYIAACPSANLAPVVITSIRTRLEALRRKIAILGSSTNPGAE